MTNMRTTFLIATSTVLLLTLAWGCHSTDDRLGYEVPRAPAGTLGVPEAGADGAANPDASSEVLYCPTSECAVGFTTCAASRFLCDTNLLSDPDNCGACGHACPRATGREHFLCVEGECTMLCSTGNNSLPFYDCDGLVDNGCEVVPNNDDHCGGCNIKCDTATDPTQACLSYFDKNNQFVFSCGCPSELTFCNFQCVDTRFDDKNCGACGNECSPTGGPQPTPPNGYYGCENQQCDSFKCNRFYLNCDGEIENGCEVMAVSDDNCGGCGIQCEAGTRCLLDPDSVPRCMCDPGTSLCVTGRNQSVGFDLGYCADFGNDDENCGGCGVECQVGTPWYLPFPGGREYCIGGSCQLRCVEGYDDCNHSPTDGCETNTLSDPRNCGGCGIECDLAAGQACAGGRCMVAPCPPDEPETAR